MPIPADDYGHISTQTTTQVYTGPCILKSIVVNTTAAGTIGIIDGISGTTVNIGQLAASVSAGTYIYNVKCSLGIRIVTGAGSDLTVTYTT